jgi:hypothetical protein
VAEDRETCGASLLAGTRGIGLKSATSPLLLVGSQQRKCVLMGGPGGPRPPGGALRGRAPLWGVAEDRRAGARGETSPLLSTLYFFFIKPRDRIRRRT